MLVLSESTFWGAYNIYNCYEQYKFKYFIIYFIIKKTYLCEDG